MSGPLPGGVAGDAGRGVTRSMEATGARTAAAVERKRRSLPNGFWGIVLLICTESSLFGTLFGTYFYLRFKTPTWPPPGVPEPDVVVPLILAWVLALTSIPMWLASRAARRGERGRAFWLIFLALFVQCGYLAMELHLFSDDLNKFSPDGSAYGSIYFTLLGADHAHVAVGLLLSLGLLVKLAQGLTNYRVVGVRAIALYWHFVNLMTLFVIGTILYAST